MQARILDPEAEIRIRGNVRYFSTMDSAAIGDRIRELERERDMERALIIGLSGIGCFGLAMGILGGRSFRLFTFLSLPLLFAYGLGKWAPERLLGRLGLRSRREIDEERFALKALRGDFQGVDHNPGSGAEGLARAASRVLDAVRT